MCKTKTKINCSFFVILKCRQTGQWWCKPWVPVLERQRQMDVWKFETSLSYRESFRIFKDTKGNLCLQIKTKRTTTTTKKTTKKLDQYCILYSMNDFKCMYPYLHKYIHKCEQSLAVSLHFPTSFLSLILASWFSCSLILQIEPWASFIRGKWFVDELYPQSIVSFWHAS